MEVRQVCRGCFRKCDPSSPAVCVRVDRIDQKEGRERSIGRRCASTSSLIMCRENVVPRLCSLFPFTDAAPVSRFPCLHSASHSPSHIHTLSTFIYFDFTISLLSDKVLFSPSLTLSLSLSPLSLCPISGSACDPDPMIK